MSLKSIELQIAIPRTQDASIKQDQLNQRPSILQHHLSEDQKLKAELDRTRSTKLEEKGDSKVMTDEQKQHEQRQQQKKQRQHQEEVTDSPHPFKGKQIDISL